MKDKVFKVFAIAGDSSVRVSEFSGYDCEASARRIFEQAKADTDTVLATISWFNPENKKWVFGQVDTYLRSPDQGSAS